MNEGAIQVLLDQEKKFAVNDQDKIIPMARLKMANGGHVYSMDESFTPMPLTNHAKKQLCGRCDMPAKYIGKLPSNIQANLFNHEFENRSVLDNGKPRKFFIRARNNFVRAVLSDVYTPVDNVELLEILISALYGKNSLESQDLHFKFHRHFNTNDGSHFFLKLTLQNVERGGYKVGIMVGNSETGQQSVSCEPFVYRLACTNDLIVTDNAFKFRHVHRSPQELKHRVFTAINQALPEAMQTAQKMIDAKHLQLPNISDTITAMTEKLGWTKERTDRVMSAWSIEPEKNIEGLVNAVTRAAQQREGLARIDEEREAFKILESGEKIVREVTA